MADRSPLTLDDLNRLKAEGVGSVWQLAFGAGAHRDGEPPWTPDDIRTILANFQALSTGRQPRLAVQVGPSHDPEAAGLWPWGLVTALRPEPGNAFSVKLDHLPARVVEAIRN